MPRDPWGNPYQYLNPGNHEEIDIYTLGRDGRPGGEGPDADIGNWDRRVACAPGRSCLEALFLMHCRQLQRGFTLIEIMVVVIIVATVVSIVAAVDGVVGGRQ